MHALTAAITPLHPGSLRFEGGLTEVGPGVHAWLQPNGLLGESNAGLVVGDAASLLVDTLWDPRLTRRHARRDGAADREGADRDPRQHSLRRRPLVGNQEVPAAEVIATESARGVMDAESPAEMKRFGALAATLRLAGSMPFPIRGATPSPP
jgi:cyclase